MQPDEKKLIILIYGDDIYYQAKLCVDIKFCDSNRDEHERAEWESKILELPKLRTYITYKNIHGAAEYVTQILSKRHRSVLVQFRSGIPPLKIEIGRFNNIPVELGLCEMCDLNSIEDETHFLLYCSLYSSPRFVLYENASQYFPEFPEMIDELKVRLLIEHPALVKATARYRSIILIPSSSVWPISPLWAGGELLRSFDMVCNMLCRCQVDK